MLTIYLIGWAAATTAFTVEWTQNLYNEKGIDTALPVALVVHTASAAVLALFWPALILTKRIKDD